MDVPVQSMSSVGLGASLDSTLMQAHELTSAAYEALGLSAQEAAQAAADGGMVLNGALVTVAPLPEGTLTTRSVSSLLWDFLGSTTLIRVSFPEVTNSRFSVPSPSSPVTSTSLRFQPVTITDPDVFEI